MRSDHRRGQVHWFVLSLTICATWAFAPLSRAQDADSRTMMIAAAHDSVPEQADDRTLSPYFFVWGSGGGVDRLPLKSSSALVDITGVIADVTLEQTYRNDGDTTLEAVYLFPASTRAAVHGMKMTVGTRVINAKIEKKATARKRYEKARANGQTASLLEQKRANVFEMSVANIMPGDEVVVELSYTELLVPEDGDYEFVMPTVVGPRYSNTPASEADDTEAWVENPYLHEGEEPTFEHDIDVHLTSPMPIARASSPSHEVSLEYEGKNEVHVGLADPAGSANRDFVLRYSLAGGKIQSGVMTFEREGERYFLMMMEPPKRVEKRQVLPREYLFILDVSGSMNGFPLDVSRRLIGEILRGLGPSEYFNILAFAGGNAIYSERSVRATAAQVDGAVEWMDSYTGGGGTELIPALKKALAMERPEGFSRIVVVATDGFVSVEKKAFDVISSSLDDANVFAFGIGTSVNRELIEGMARAGQGEPFVVMEEREAMAAAESFRRYVASPLLTGLEVRFDGFDAYDVEPVEFPDLFASRPVVAVGKYRGKASGKIVLTGNNADGEWSSSQSIGPSVPPDDAEALPYLWARKRITRLTDGEAIGKSAGKEITSLGMTYGLLTRYTSFVAVDTVVRANGVKTRKVRQPLAMPAGVSDNAVGDNFGYGELGLRGTGRGGGGVGQGTIGLGSIGTIGHGGGGGSGVGYGRGSGGLASVHGNAPRIKMGNVQVKGSLSKDVIRQVIRARIGQFKLAYEKRLKTKPGLEGQVVIKFVIDATGKVVSATIASSTLNDDVVEKEMVRLMKRLVFPSTGGGVIVVNYPFTFKSAGN